MHQLANDNLDTSPSWFDFPSRYTKQAVVTGPWTIKSASCIFRNRWHKHVPQKRKVSYENLFFESITVEEYVLGSIFPVWWNWLELVQNIQLFRDLESLQKKKSCIVLLKDIGPQIAIWVGSFTNCCAFKCTTTHRLTRNMEWNGKVQSLGFIKLLVWSWVWGAKGKVF